MSYGLMGITAKVIRIKCGFFMCDRNVCVLNELVNMTKLLLSFLEQVVLICYTRK